MMIKSDLIPGIQSGKITMVVKRAQSDCQLGKIYQVRVGNFSGPLAFIKITDVWRARVPGVVDDAVRRCGYSDRQKYLDAMKKMFRDKYVGQYYVWLIGFELATESGYMSQQYDLRSGTHVYLDPECMEGIEYGDRYDFQTDGTPRFLGNAHVVELFGVEKNQFITHNKRLRAFDMERLFIMQNGKLHRLKKLTKKV